MHFDLDPKVLDQRYKQLQWQFHPDKASLRPKQEQEWAADHATAINRAYSILKSPLSRATYMVREMVWVTRRTCDTSLNCACEQASLQSKADPYLGY